MNDYWKIGILVVLLGGSYGLHKYFETKAVNTAITTTKTTITKEYQDQVLAANKKAADAEQSLATFKSKADNDKQVAVQGVTDKYATLVSSLSNRPTRADLSSSVSAAVARAKSACTGAGLYGDDAKFLAGYASLAAKSVIDRDYYYGQYENARRTLAGQKPDAGLNGASSNAVDVSGNRLQH